MVKRKNDISETRERVLSILKSEIESGEIAFGEQLPTSKELIKLYGASAWCSYEIRQVLKREGYIADHHYADGKHVTLVIWEPQ